MPDAKRILLVDDDDAFRSALARTLTRAGYVIVEAVNGREALERYRAAPFDLVLSDIYMPGADGVEAMIRLQAEFPDARIIVMSGGGHMASESVLDLATRLGARAALGKPLATGALLQTIEDVLAKPSE